LVLGILNTKKVDISLPLEYKSFISKNISLISKTARNYLTKRGITEKDIIMYKIGYAIEGELRNRIIFLSFSDSGDLNFYTARNFLKEGQNYINSNKFLENKIVNSDIRFTTTALYCDRPLYLSGYFVGTTKNVYSAYKKYAKGKPRGK
jgi:hypothetical protein